jgi:hypothetical protein
MNQNSIILSNDYVRQLISLQGISIGRCASMVWIIFGKDESEYALHLQCCFRIRDREGLLVTNMEMYQPSTAIVNKPNFQIDSFDWDVQGDNRFDEWVKKLSPAISREITVVDARVNAYGDLTIYLEQNIVIEAFIDVSTDECWRLFQTNSKRHHFVMLGNGIEEDEEDEEEVKDESE